MFRFFVDKKEGSNFKLSESVIKHIKVARIIDKQFICIYEGTFYVCELIPNTNLAKINKTINENHEHNNEVVIAASIIDTKRFEWMIQKSAELGATKIIPMISKNISKKIPNDINKKIERWNQIALNASEQSFRNYPMLVSKIQNMEDVLNENAKKYENKFIAHEKFDDEVKSTFPTNSIFLVGPEGGFSDEEFLLAKNNGWKPITLGKRILRSETASLFILSKII